MMGLADQFGRPRGMLGALVGRGMARGNAALSMWVVQQAAELQDGPLRQVAELGCGPGVGLTSLLAQFEGAQVLGIDLSPVMLAQARKRNQRELATGRLTLIEGDTSALAESGPFDLVMANHVLYFWHDPEAEMATVRKSLRPGGTLAIGYQLRQNMPAMAQKRFPLAGHLLYESADAVTELARAAGYSSVVQRVKGSDEAPEGRVMLAIA